MGKKQHQKDKMYLTPTEWNNEFGGYKSDRATKQLRAKFKRLPITHCSLSFTEFENPVCTKEGQIFDIVNILPFIKKYGMNPVTGEKLMSKDLIKLNFHKNKDSDFHCPVTYKVFNSNSHIVAIKPTGNVYSWEAVETLNIKTKIYKDLLDDTPFIRSDVITLQDPECIDKFNIENFHHVKLNLKSDAEIVAEKKAMADPQFTLRRVNNEAKEALKQLATDYKESVKETKKEEESDEINAAHYSTGLTAASFTSTSMDRQTKTQSAVLDEETLRYRRVKKNGYVQLQTNKGQLNLELYCVDCPKTCENFITLCKNNYYNNTIFHRIIKNFMMQGGDPTGTGTGGQSCWGEPFKDEIVMSLHHAGRGVLSMANAGTNSNKSQFFITFRSAKHLDGKHTIFGRVVGGLETLTIIESTPTGEKDRPIENVKLMTAKVFVDPFEEAQAQLDNEREQLKEKKQKELNEQKKNDEKRKAEANAECDKLTSKRTDVGRYLPSSPLASNVNTVFGIAADNTQMPPLKKKAKVLKTALDDFSSW